MGVISACIPSLRPLVSLLLRGTVRGLGVSDYGSGKQVSSSVSHSAWRSRAGEGDDDNSSKPNDSVSDPQGQRWGHDVEVLGGRGGGRGAEDEISLEAMNVPQGVIQVKDEVVVTSSDWLEYKDKVF